MARERMRDGRERPRAATLARRARAGPDGDMARPARCLRGRGCCSRCSRMPAIGQSPAWSAVARRVERRRSAAGKPRPVQRQGPEEEEEPLQGRFEPVQLQDRRKRRSRVQGRFEPVQLQGPEEEEEPCAGAVRARAASGTGGRGGAVAGAVRAGPAPGPRRSRRCGRPRLRPARRVGARKRHRDARRAQGRRRVAVRHVARRGPRPLRLAGAGRLDAVAFTQGSEIHVAPGQKRHLPHEAWHVVQQAQGRVQPTTQLQVASRSTTTRRSSGRRTRWGAKASAIAAKAQLKADEAGPRID